MAAITLTAFESHSSTNQLLDHQNLTRSSRNSWPFQPASIVNGYPMEGNVVSFCKPPPYNVQTAATPAAVFLTTSSSSATPISISISASVSCGSSGVSLTSSSSASGTPEGPPSTIFHDTSAAATPATAATANSETSSITTSTTTATTITTTTTTTAINATATTTATGNGSVCATAVPAVTLRGASRRLAAYENLTELDSEVEQQLHTIEGVHAVFGSHLLHLPTQPAVPNQKVVTAVAGTGLAPWEIHRPQIFVRELVLRRVFTGRVLDAGCGIGDNALYVAKAAPGAEVTAVDVVPRCLDFASTKAGMRGMRGKVSLMVADLRRYDKLPEELRSQPYDVVLDSYTFHGFTDEDRGDYVATLAQMLRPDGMMYMGCMSEEETRIGGPRRITVEEVRRVFEGSGSAIRPDWRLEGVEDAIAELHPTFWGGKGKARLYTIRRL